MENPESIEYKTVENYLRCCDKIRKLSFKKHLCMLNNKPFTDSEKLAALENTKLEIIDFCNQNIFSKYTATQIKNCYNIAYKHYECLTLKSEALNPASGQELIMCSTCMELISDAQNLKISSLKETAK